MTTPTLIVPTLAHLSGHHTLDPTHTRIGFVARHAMVTKVRGSFNDFSGTGVLDGSNPDASSASVTMRAASIDTRQAQRDEHLRSEDLLATEEFPTNAFVSTSVAQTDEAEFELTGDLTVKDVSESVTIPFTWEGAATDPYANLRVGFAGSVVIKRSDYRVNCNAALETGGVLISEKVALEFEVRDHKRLTRHKRSLS